MDVQLPITLRGGARTGRVHSSWPFARLRIEARSLSLNAHFKEFRFEPEDSIEVVPETHVLFRVPIGIRIVHARDDLPAPLVFWYLRSNRLWAFLEASEFGSRLRRRDA